MQATPTQRAESYFRELLVHQLVPEHLHNGLIRYLVHGIRPGDFLFAIVTNNLTEAVVRAPSGGGGLLEVVRFLVAYAPPVCYGSPETVDAWLQSRVIAIFHSEPIEKAVALLELAQGIVDVRQGPDDAVVGKQPRRSKRVKAHGAVVAADQAGKDGV